MLVRDIRLRVWLEQNTVGPALLFNTSPQHSLNGFWGKVVVVVGVLQWHHTWAYTEDLVKVSTDAHLLVELGGLGQVGAGLEVGHSKHVGPALTGRWKGHTHTC